MPSVCASPSGAANPTSTLTPSSNAWSQISAAAVGRARPSASDHDGSGKPRAVSRSAAERASGPWAPAPTALIARSVASACAVPSRSSACTNPGTNRSSTARSGSSPRCHVPTRHDAHSSASRAVHGRSASRAAIAAMLAISSSSSASRAAPCRSPDGTDPDRPAALRRSRRCCCRRRFSLMGASVNPRAAAARGLRAWSGENARDYSCRSDAACRRKRASRRGSPRMTPSSRPCRRVTAYERLEAALAGVEPPFAVVDLDALRANADDLVRRAAGKPLRVASKSVRCRSLLLDALARSGFRGVMTFTLPETLWLHDHGFGDLLLGYPATDRAALAALAQLDAERPPALMVDSVEQLDLSDAEVLAPALACGCTVVWTPAPSTAVCSGVLAECIAAADLPPGVFNLVLGPGPEVGDELAVNPDTQAVAFTGSTATGLTVARRAAGKVQLLEMGGNGPFVVMHDADLEAAATAASVGCFLGAGQSCSAAERLLVHEAVRDEFVALLADEVRREVRLGDPLDDATTMGPLNNEPTAGKMDRHVADAVERGATVVTGGSRANGFPTSLYWEPTVLDGVPPDSVAVTEETFGPIAPIVAIGSLEDAIEQTNAQSYGLMAAIFTRNLAAGMRYADSVPMGLVNINETTNYWELHLPWGGRARSESGIGRVGGHYPMDTLTALQTVMFRA